MIKYGLVKGRHEIPNVEKCIFGEVADPTNIIELEKIAYETIEKDIVSSLDNVVTVYVTGLTTATVAVINAVLKLKLELCLMHYNRETGEYFPQWLYDTEEW